MNGLNVSLHDYQAARIGPPAEIRITPLEVKHTPDLQMLEWAGTGFTIMTCPDRLRELAAIILDKFPLVAPLPEPVQPIEDPRNRPQPMTGDSPSLIFMPLNNSEASV